MDQILREATGATKDRMLRELGDALAALTAETPVLLVLEDVHWIDPASVDMLRHLAERTHGQRLLLIATARPEDIERNNPTLKKCYTEMHARGRLRGNRAAGSGSADIAAYLDAHFAPNEFPAELASVIHGKSEGHPLFATGAIQILAERGDIVRTNGAWKLKQPLAQIELDVPVSVRSMIEKKVGLLSDAQRQALQYASIEGEVFTSTVLAALLEADELDLEERLDVLGKVHRLIQVEGEEELPDGSVATVYRFTHALYQNFLYDQLLSKRRVLLHRRAGETLERVYAGQHARVAGALATHFERGRDFSKADQYLIQAGDNALSRYANAEAVNYFSRGTRSGGQAAGRAASRAQTNRALAQARRIPPGAGATEGLRCRLHAMRDVCRAAGNLEEECRALVGISDRRAQPARARRHRAIRAGGHGAGGANRKSSPGRRSRQQSGAFTSMAVTGRLSRSHRPISSGPFRWRGPLDTSRLYRQDSCTVASCIFGRANTPRPNRPRWRLRQVAAEVRDGFYLPLALLYLGLTRANRGRISEAMALHAGGVRSGQAQQQRRGVVARRQRDRLGLAGDRRSFQGHRIQQGMRRGYPATRAAEAEANGLINLVYDYLLAAANRVKPPRPWRVCSRSTSANVGIAGASMAFAIAPPKPSIG